MQSFRINEHLEAVCEWKKTRNGFKHTATLLLNGIEQKEVKVCYLNRTWERYTYESVLYKLMEKSKDILSGDEIVEFKTTIVNGGEKDEDSLKLIANIARLGE